MISMRYFIFLETQSFSKSDQLPTLLDYITDVDYRRNGHKYIYITIYVLFGE